MGNHNTSTSNMLLKTLGDDIPKTVTFSSPTKDIGRENKIQLPQQSRSIGNKIDCF